MWHCTGVSISPPQMQVVGIWPKANKIVHLQCNSSLCVYMRYSEYWSAKKCKTSFLTIYISPNDFNVNALRLELHRCQCREEVWYIQTYHGAPMYRNNSRNVLSLVASWENLDRGQNPSTLFLRNKYQILHYYSLHFFLLFGYIFFVLENSFWLKEMCIMSKEKFFKYWGLAFIELVSPNL